MSNKIIALLFFGCSLLLTQAVFAESDDKCEHFKEMAQTLNLDEAQKTKIKGIRDQFKESHKNAKEEMKNLSGQIDELIKSENLDQEKLSSLVNKKSSLIADMIKAKIITKNQIYNTLNAQQKTKFQEMMKKWHEKMAMKYKEC